MSNTATARTIGQLRDTAGFYEYCHSFYGPAKIYGDFFHHKLTVRTLKAAIAKRITDTSIPFEGDSVDREMVRDIALAIHFKK